MATKQKTKRIRTRKNYDEQCQDVIQKYFDAGKPWPSPMKHVARWAAENNMLTRRVPSMIDLLAKDLSKAARKEYITDPQGRRVRRFHAFRKDVEIGEDYVQYTLWTDINTAAPGDMQLSLQQRRLGIVGDCKQLKTDGDSYNDNNPHGAEIALSLNFEQDIAELEQATEYNPGPPPDHDGI